MMTFIEAMLLALVDAAEEKAHHMEWSCCGDACCKPVEKAADRLVSAAREVRQYVIDNHTPCKEFTGCKLCKQEFGIPDSIECKEFWAKLDAIDAEQALGASKNPPPGSYAETARIMAEMFPNEDWDAWKDEMKERDL